MNRSRLLGAVCAGSYIFLSTATSAALIDNGGGLIYDNVLNITWSQPDAVRSWDDSQDWAAGLTLGGATDWRLAYISVEAGAGRLTDSPIDCSAATELACRDNELGYMFYHNLGGTSGTSILTSDDPDLGLFPTLQSARYWYGGEFGLYEPVFAFGFDNGIQGQASKGIGGIYSWAVHEGNIGEVPVPAAAWLFGSGLVGLVAMARRKKAV